MFKKVVFITFVVFLLAGCTRRIVDFTIISTKNVAVPVDSKGLRIKGEDCVVVILFPFGVPTIKEAIDRAIENAGPEYDALIDGVIYAGNYSFIFGQQCFIAEGTAINTKLRKEQQLVQ